MVNLSGEIGKRYMRGFLESHSPYVDVMLLHVQKDINMEQYGIKPVYNGLFPVSDFFRTYANPEPEGLLLALHDLSLTSEIAELDQIGGHLNITILPSPDGATNIDADVIESIVAARRMIGGGGRR